MKLLVLAAWLSVATTEDVFSVGISPQMVTMIACLDPDIPPTDYIKYGCYCGGGKSGSPVDEQDRCCQELNSCWNQATEMENCSSSLDTYFKSYSYFCAASVITCSSESNPCEDFICNCDRTAVMCFIKAPRPQEKYYNLDRKKYCRD